MPDTKSLLGRRLLITGAASGIGLATTALAREAGAEIVGIVRDRDRAQELIELIGIDRVVVADLAQPDGPRESVEGAVAILGGLDGVVLAAGIFFAKPFLETTPEDLSQILTVNVAANFLLLQQAMPQLREGNASSVVMVSSINEFVAHPRASAYTLSKSALGGLTRSLAIEFAKWGIRVNCVAPGPTITKMTIAARNDPQRKLELLSNVPMNRFGDAEEIAQAILFLVGSHSSFVTGESLAVDGGYTAR